jgi:hypothetical protein
MSLTIVLAFSVRVSMVLSFVDCWQDLFHHSCHPAVMQTRRVGTTGEGSHPS